MKKIASAFFICLMTVNKFAVCAIEGDVGSPEEVETSLQLVETGAQVEVISVHNPAEQNYVQAQLVEPVSQVETVESVLEIRNDSENCSEDRLKQMIRENLDFIKSGLHHPDEEIARITEIASMLQIVHGSPGVELMKSIERAVEISDFSIKYRDCKLSYPACMALIRIETSKMHRILNRFAK